MFKLLTQLGDRALMASIVKNSESQTITELNYFKSESHKNNMKFVKFQKSETYF